MESKILGCVVTDISKDQIHIKEIQLGEKISIRTEDAKAYSPGDLVTIDSQKKVLVDRMEDYPFI